LVIGRPQKLVRAALHFLKAHDYGADYGIDKKYAKCQQKRQNEHKRRNLLGVEEPHCGIALLHPHRLLYMVLGVFQRNTPINLAKPDMA
jgi:hypothetical protein